MKQTTAVFDLDSDTDPYEGQILVTIWGNGRATVAFRQQPWHSWSPPTESTKLEINTVED
jgi:hypothetical protein